MTGFPYWVTPHTIRKGFDRVIWAKTEVDGNGRSLSLAYIRFRSNGDAEKAVRLQDNRKWVGGQKVYLCLIK